MKTGAFIIELGIILLSPIVPGKRINLALNKTAYQSTSYHVGGGDASQAVDGNTAPLFYDFSCAHTDDKSGDWWEVDLGSSYNIKEVIVYNRLDCCVLRLGNYILSGGIDCAHTESRKCYTECYHQQTADLVHVLRPNNCTARYIRIETQLEEVLTLCEVEVFDELLKGQKTNLALNKPAHQISVSGLHDASRAVDGNTAIEQANNSCAHTDTGERDWWEVDLGAIYDIEEVIVNNTVDVCCVTGLSNYILSGGVDCKRTNTGKCYTECYHHQRVNIIQVLTMSSCTARYIRITSQLSDYLHICEVGVFGKLVQDATVTTTEDTSTTIPDTITTTADVNTPEVSSFTTEESLSTSEDTPVITKDTTTTTTTDGSLTSTEDRLASTEDGLASTEDMITTIITEGNTTTTVDALSTTKTITNTNPEYKINATKNLKTTAEYMNTENKSTTPTDITQPNYTRTTTEGSISTVEDIINTTEDITDTIKETNMPTTEWTSAKWQMNNSIKAQSCGCFCHVVYQTQQDNKHIIEAYKEEISRKLVVPVKTLSKTIQKKISAEDRRPSAVYCGYIGIVAIVVSLGGFVIADFVSFLSYIHRCIAQ